jgi:hypothetical protein
METYLKNCRCCMNKGDDLKKTFMEQRLASIYFNFTGIEVKSIQVFLFIIIKQTKNYANNPKILMVYVTNI